MVDVVVDDVLDVVVVSTVESGVVPGVVVDVVDDVVVVVDGDVVVVVVSGELWAWTAAAEVGHPNHPVSRIDWQKATSPRIPAALPSEM